MIGRESGLGVKLSTGVIVVTRIVAAPRELVFKAWADPRHVARWWGPHGLTMQVCELSVRPGGPIHIEMVQNLERVTKHVSLSRALIFG